MWHKYFTWKYSEYSAFGVPFYAYFATYHIARSHGIHLSMQFRNLPAIRNYDDTHSWTYDLLHDALFAFDQREWGLLTVAARGSCRCYVYTSISEVKGSPASHQPDCDWWSPIYSCRCGSLRKTIRSSPLAVFGLIKLLFENIFRAKCWNNTWMHQHPWWGILLFNQNIEYSMTLYCIVYDHTDSFQVVLLQI